MFYVYVDPSVPFVHTYTTHTDGGGEGTRPPGGLSRFWQRDLQHTCQPGKLHFPLASQTSSLHLIGQMMIELLIVIFVHNIYMRIQTYQIKFSATVDREIFTSHEIFMLINFRGLFNPWNFLNDLRLHNGWAPRAFLAFSLLPGIGRASYHWL